MNVELVARSGWSVKVKSDDEVFSPLFLPYTDLGSEVPSLIRLGDVLSEILERGWPSYTQLLELKSFLRRAGELEIHGTLSGGLFYDEIKDAHIIMSATYPDVIHTISVPLLKSFNGLDRVLNMPDGWEKYVSVDYSVSEKERHNHILAQGKAMLDTGVTLREVIREHNRDIQYTTPSIAIRYLFDMRNSIWNLEPEEERYVDQVFYGILRNATLLHNNRSDHIPHTCVLWRDLRALIGDRIPNDREECSNTLALLSGEPERIESLFRLDVWNFPKTLADCDRVEGIYELYDMIVPLIPNVILHGIEMFTIGEIYPGHGDLLDVIRCVNACIIREYIVRESKSRLDMDDYDSIVFILGGLRGRRTLSCMLPVLIRDLSEPNHDYFTDVLRGVADSITRYLEEDQPSGTFDELYAEAKRRYSK